MSRNYLFRQDDPAVAALRYGRAGKTVDRVGCGLVAIYNLMKRLGCPQELSAVIQEAQRLHMPWLFGLFGTKPRSLGRYFRKMGVPFTRTDSCAAFREQLGGAAAAIVCTWNDKRTDGIHFYTIFNENGRLTSLNLCCADAPLPFSASSLRGDRFITGYLFFDSEQTKSP